MSTPRIPGENALYRDMYNVICEASEELELGEMLTMPNITMMDAMNAIKIGDPRMDSGFGNGNTTDKPAFNVHERLLPDEICWLLDQTFAAEMFWHHGVTLTQSVFTILYMHHLGYHTAWSSLQGVDPPDHTRPPQLVNLVLASGVMGMTKSVDLAWREFAKGCVYEHEDWQADKAGVSMLENVSTRDVISLIKSATNWLQSYGDIESRTRQALLERLHLRKLWINALHLSLPRESASLFAHVAQIRHALARVRMLQIPSPSPSSMARRAIDPDVKRRLKFTSPLEAIPLPDMNETWNFFDELLAGMGDACDISDKRSPIMWENLLRLASSQKPSPRYCAFVRASTSYAIFDGSRVLGEVEPEWLVDKALEELAGLPAGMPQHLIALPMREDLASSMQQCILKFGELLLNYHTTLCHNRPRQRRIYSNALPHWRDLLLIAADLDIKFRIVFPDLTLETHVLHRVHLTMQYYRCLIALEVVFSGFELELYNKSEWLPILRFSSSLLRRQAHILNGLLDNESEIAASSTSVRFLQMQLSFVGALQAMVYGSIMGFLSANPVQYLLSEERQQRNMERRFKWALPENGVQDDLQPNWSGNVRWIQEHAVGDPAHLRSEAVKWFNTAQSSLDSLLHQADDVPYYDLCRPAFRSALTDLIRTCRKCITFWRNDEREPPVAIQQIEWIVDGHSWFLVPRVRK